MLVWFLPLFLIFLLIGLPVFFGLLAAPGILLWLNDQARDGAMLYRNIYNGIDSFPLMAIPFFMLAGELMNRGGITHRLVEFSQAMMGHLKGGLAHVNVLTSMLFAGLSGSAVADTSAIGSMLIPSGTTNLEIWFSLFDDSTPIPNLTINTIRFSTYIYDFDSSATQSLSIVSTPITEKGFDETYGARPLRRAVMRLLEDLSLIHI